MSERAHDLPPRWDGRHKVSRHWWRSLTAFRCHHCSLDTIWDISADEWWTLDDSDYGDEGSTAQAQGSAPPSP